ncbi:hypothetical protein F5148DRAFT_1237090 [Russula earlei]|uniref:Uncharacterized protein n=1 Tax=Russula earlei TaxID=71964 RepID=A0ACC0TY09_9AGAM|nr:hypothetical protein F5148DRAFT_1237090 [Russula earlei]
MRTTYVLAIFSLAVGIDPSFSLSCRLGSNQNHEGAPLSSSDSNHAVPKENPPSTSPHIMVRRAPLTDELKDQKHRLAISKEMEWQKLLGESERLKKSYYSELKDRQQLPVKRKSPLGILRSVIERFREDKARGYWWTLLQQQGKDT